MEELKDGVSIITIVLNGEKFIEETIQSVLNQKNVKIEYIIIDGGSVDCTINKIEKYKVYIDHFVSGPDGGIYNAINKGILLAKYPLIGIIHCGDYYESNAVSIAYEAFKKNKADVIYGDINSKEEGNEGSIIHFLKANHLNLKDKMSIFHPSTFVKSSSYLKLGTYNTKYKCAADYDLFLNFYMQQCVFYYLPKVLATFRSGGMSSNIILSLKETFLIRNNRLNFIAALKYIIKKGIISLYFRSRRFIVKSIIGEKKYFRLKIAKSKNKN